MNVCRVNAQVHVMVLSLAGEDLDVNGAQLQECSVGRGKLRE